MLHLLKKIDKNSNIWRDYLLIYLLLITKAGFCFYERFSSISSFGLLFCIIICLIRSKSKINDVQVGIILTLIGLITLTGLIKGFPELNVFFLQIINLLTSLGLVMLIPYKRFSRQYSNILFLICLVSIVGQMTFNIGLPIVNNLPILVNSQGRSVYFAVLAEFWTAPSSGTYRVQGIFWEPGAFQAMIIIAFLFDIYINKPLKHKKLRYVCYAGAILLTYSTTGIICLLMMVVLLGVRGKNFKVKNFFFLSLISVIFIILISVLSSRLEGFMYYSTFGKLELLYDAFTYGESNDATSRSDSIIYPLIYFFKSPIFGIGQDGIDQMTKLLGHNMFTCTAINFFAFYGICCGFICIYGFYRLLNLKNKSFIEGFVLVLILLITTSSENFAFNAIFTCFILYGYCSVKKKHRKYSEYFSLNRTKKYINFIS